MRRMLSVLVATAVLALVAGPLSAADHAAVGADKCGKMCHKVEYDSWAKSKHATAADKKADCETCHGNGADYMKLSVMKDPVKAKEAGLIAKPDKASCAKCHKPAEITDEAMANVHAKKKKA